MSPKMRSIFAQVHRNSVSMGSRRNFSSSAASSESNVAGFYNEFTFFTSFKLGFCVWAFVGYYKVYKNYYPKLLIYQEEYKRRVHHQNELYAQTKMDSSLKST